MHTFHYHIGNCWRPLDCCRLMRKVSKLVHCIMAPSLLIGLSAVLGGCGPAAMPVAEPTSTAVSHLTENPGENHFSIPGAAVTPGPSPTPFGRSDPPVELVPGAQESIRPVTDGLPADPGSDSAAMVLRKSRRHTREARQSNQGRPVYPNKLGQIRVNHTPGRTATAP